MTIAAQARDDARAILDAALASVVPQTFFRARIRRDGTVVWIRGAGGTEIPVDFSARRTRVAAIGKAARGMAAQSFWIDAEERLLVAPSDAEVEGWETIRGAHPVPDEESERAGRRVLEFAAETAEEDLLVLLLSGGASSLAEAPSIPLRDLATTSAALLRSGATIHEVNAVRKHLSDLKGGRLAEATRGRIVSLVLSDVPGDDLSVVASGPAYADATTFADAIAVLEGRGIWETSPASVREHLEAGADGRRPETPKPGDRTFDRVEHHVLASNATALDAAAIEARRRGYAVEVLHGGLFGEARAAGERLAALARVAVSGERPRAILVGGETTVTVRGAGRGGRNQETVLAAVRGIAGLPVLVASFGTDGVDGPTDAAGAIADGATLARSQAVAKEVEEHLAENDAYPFFEGLRDLLRTGPTGTNVMDVALVLVHPAGAGNIAGKG